MRIEKLIEDKSKLKMMMFENYCMFPKYRDHYLEDLVKQEQLSSLVKVRQLPTVINPTFKQI